MDEQMDEQMDRALQFGLLAEDALDRASEARGFTQQQALIAGSNWYSMLADRAWRKAIERQGEQWHLTADDRLFS